MTCSCSTHRSGAESDRGRDIGNDTWVLAHVRGADTSKVGKRGLNFSGRSAVGSDACNDRAGKIGLLAVAIEVGIV